MNRSNLLFPALLVLFWLLMVLIVNPIGNFPLNDDWQYARPVWFMVNKGFYLTTDEYSPVLAAQVLWGTLFCLPGGFSFTALRISTLFLSFIGVMVFYYVLLKVSKNPKLSFLGSLLLAANPLFILSSQSFMTEVPFLTFSIFSIYFFFCYMETNKRKDIITATLFAIIATLIRQYGIVIPIAFAVASIIKNRSKILLWGKYFMPAIITLVALKAVLLWLEHIGSPLIPYVRSNLMDFLSKPGDITFHSLEWGSTILIYTGFFLLPILVWVTNNTISQMTKRQKMSVTFAVFVLSPLIILWCHQLPLGNTLHDFGVGVRTLKGIPDSNPDFTPGLFTVLKILAFSGMVLLLINYLKIIIDISNAYKNRSFTPALFKQTFAVLFILGYAILIFIPDFFFDRYLIPFFPVTTILILAGINESFRLKPSIYITCCAIVLAMGLFSSALTHDYLAWNRSRWQAADYLTKELKISPHKIDGGYEYNGWVLDFSFPNNPKNPNRSWWCVDDDEYVISFNNIDGYTIIKQIPYQNYFPYQTKNICILHRK